MEERRKLPRKYLMIFSSVRDNNTSEELGYLSDLSLEGLMLISKTPKEAEKEIELYIELPEEPNFLQKKIIIAARTIWCEADIDPRLYNIGFKFKNLSQKDKAVIEKMIEVYQFSREHKLFPPSVSEINRNVKNEKSSSL